MDRKGRNKEEFFGSKHSMYGYILTDLLQAVMEERLSSVFSPDWTFNFCAHSSPLQGVREDLANIANGRFSKKIGEENLQKK